jgi:molybdopterin-guanine dinucleotide biosynthesis protein A
VANRALTGVLLVGGESTRFGAPKALARHDGSTLADLAWHALEFCEERLAVGKAADHLDLPFPILDDRSDVRAPIAGVVAALRAARHEVALIVPVDTPRIDRASLEALAAACRDAAVPQTGPLPGAYRASALPVLERNLAAGELSLRRALDELDVAIVRIDPVLLVNVNTPDDLARL